MRKIPQLEIANKALKEVVEACEAFKVARKKSVDAVYDAIINSSKKLKLAQDNLNHARAQAAAEKIHNSTTTKQTSEKVIAAMQEVENANEEIGALAMVAGFAIPEIEKKLNLLRFELNEKKHLKKGWEQTSLASPDRKFFERQRKAIKKLDEEMHELIKEIQMVSGNIELLKTVNSSYGGQAFADSQTILQAKKSLDLAVKAYNIRFQLRKEMVEELELKKNEIEELNRYIIQLENAILELNPDSPAEYLHEAELSSLIFPDESKQKQNSKYFIISQVHKLANSGQ